MAAVDGTSGQGDAERRTTDVFIVGGGPVGLSMALALERFGVDCVLVDCVWVCVLVLTCSLAWEEVGE